MAHTIVTIAGSLRKQSFTLKIAHALVKLAPSSLTLDVITPARHFLLQPGPRSEPAGRLDRIPRKLQKSNGILFVTPEYNRSIPGVLKNAIDVGSRPYGKSSFNGKPVGIVSNLARPLGGVSAGEASAEHFARHFGADPAAAGNLPERHWRRLRRQGRVHQGSRCARYCSSTSTPSPLTSKSTTNRRRHLSGISGSINRGAASSAPWFRAPASNRS